MASSPFSSPTLRGSSPSPIQELDLSIVPPVYVLPTHLSTEDLHNLEDQLQDHGAPVTYDINEARFVIGKVGTQKRAQFELRSRGLWTAEVEARPVKAPIVEKGEPPKKRARWNSSKNERKSAIEALADGSATESEEESEKSRVVESTEKRSIIESAANPVEAAAAIATMVDSSTESEDVSLSRKGSLSSVKTQRTPSIEHPEKSIFDNMDFSKSVRVIKLLWLEESFLEQRLLPIDKYLIYEGHQIQGPPSSGTAARKQEFFPATLPKLSPKSQHTFAERPQIQSILERVKADASATVSPAQYSPVLHGPRRFGQRGEPSQLHGGVRASQRVKLLEMTTSEYEGSDSDIPPAPDWVKRRLKYSCQRSTPANPPNDPFIKELKKIKLSRLLNGDDIGVRSYSTFVAAVAAYPHIFSNPREILRLPGCDVKLTNLWIEWKNTGYMEEAQTSENDETIKGLKVFYDIWGVGATTAREFYFDKGWRDTDDVIESGWSTLNRVQQIGLKYYEEFKEPIPRSEVEYIASKVREHAVKVRDDGIELMVVGGYRRGKEESGDVDMIVSHRHIEKTADLISDIVASLEIEGWITHTLTLSLRSTHRGQSTLPFKSVGVASHGAGFDTLDKALVVWQDPSWPTKDADLAKDPQTKNPNIHRRVDIIISPWRTVGCAITGWSGGTTFQRDLRRYVKATKNWKFDSSGVRDRSSGEVVELEGPDGVSGDMLEAEKAVFEGLGLTYRPPQERCTG